MSKPVPQSWRTFIDLLVKSAGRSVLGSVIAEFKVSAAIQPGHFGLMDDGEKATVYFANQEDMSVFTDLLREALGDDGTKVPHG